MSKIKFESRPVEAVFADAMLSHLPDVRVRASPSRVIDPMNPARHDRYQVGLNFIINGEEYPERAYVKNLTIREGDSFVVDLGNHGLIYSFSWNDMLLGKAKEGKAYAETD